MIRFAQNILSPAKYYHGPIWLNKFGYQYARVALSHFVYNVRRASQNGTDEDIMIIERDGIVSLDDFLSADDFITLKKLVNKMDEEGSFKTEENRNGSGVTWTHGAIPTNDEDGAWIVEKIANNDRLIKVIEAVSNRKVKRLPQVVYQKLHLPVGSTHEKDVDVTLHADRHYVTLKAYFGLHDITADNGAYIWCPGSHKLNQERLRHEFEYSIREAQFRKFGIDNIDPQLIENGRNAIHPDFRDGMALEEVTINSKPNTMVVSNNCGFHKRGTLSEGQTRQQLRLVFHYLEEPIIAKIFWKVIGISAHMKLLPQPIINKFASKGLIKIKR